MGSIQYTTGTLNKRLRNGDLDRHTQVPVYLYFTVGNRANIGTGELNKQGFNAFSIEGGFIAWKREVEGRQSVVKLEKFKEVYDKDIKQY